SSDLILLWTHRPIPGFIRRCATSRDRVCRMISPRGEVGIAVRVGSRAFPKQRHQTKYSAAAGGLRLHVQPLTIYRAQSLHLTRCGLCESDCCQAGTAGGGCPCGATRETLNKPV